MANKNRPFIGIDLGTYNSVACAIIDGQPTLLQPEEFGTGQDASFPSVVEFDESGNFVQAGEMARRSLALYPQSVIWGVKRLIGRSYESAKATGELNRYAYKIQPNTDASCGIHVGGQVLRPREITSFLLRKIKRDAEADFNPLGVPVYDVVITVPAFFDPKQKHETEQAALEAGFEHVHLLPEPTAAASAYRLHADVENQYLVVVDLGAGTLDVTVAMLFLDEHGNLKTQEKSHGGDVALGGLDMDDALMNAILSRRELRHLSDNPQTRMRLRTELERAKIALSSTEQSSISLSVEGKSICFQLTRRQLAEIVKPVVDRCRGPIRAALSDAGLSVEDVSKVLLVGGPTLMPIVRETIAEEFIGNRQIYSELRSGNLHSTGLHPMQAVAQGAVLGAVGKVSPHGYGILFGDVYHEMLDRRSRYPSKGKSSWSWFGKENTIRFGLVRKSINPSTSQEEYFQLGVFEFDCVPTGSLLNFEFQWNYDDNGVLHLEARQPGEVAMPLYDLSRLDGHPISKPRRPGIRSLESADSMDSHLKSIGQRAKWTDADLHQAILFAARLVDVVDQGNLSSNPVKLVQIHALRDELRGWLNDEAADINVRTPHLRDLGRSLMTLLHTNRLIDAQQLGILRQGL